MLKKIVKKIIYISSITIMILVINSFHTQNNSTYTKTNIVYDKKENMYANNTLNDEVIEVTSFSDILKYAQTRTISFKGTMTGYGPDCKGCSGIVACSPYPNVTNNIYFNDKDYGKIRILAADSKIPCGTIIKISNLKDYNEFYAIVLDRGGVIKNTLFDLLFSSEKETISFGRNTSTYTIERWGW